MSRKVALTGAERKAALQTVLAKLAGKHGSSNVTRRMVAQLGKVSESLVSTYFGDTAALRKAAKAAAKKAGIAEPSPEQQEIIGVKLRAHGPRDKRDTRKRSVKEVEAIKRKAAPAKKSAAGRVSKPAAKPTSRKSTSSKGANSSSGERETKPTKPAERKPTGPKEKPAAPARERKPTGPAERKSAAREPKAPPPLPELPTLQQDGPPPLPKNLVGSFP